MRPDLVALKRRSSLAAAALLFSGALVVAAPAPLACAGEGPDAALVVDTGSAEYRYCIALDAERVSGLHVIELANEQHGLSYSLGYQGQAVCMLAGVGSDEEECFHGGEPFWGYWRGSSSGGWTWSGTGAGGTTVEDGDVEGWSWGTGNDGTSHQQPPITSHASVCGAEEDPNGDDGASSDGTRRKKERARPGPTEERAEASSRGTQSDPASGTTSAASNPGTGRAEANEPKHARSTPNDKNRRDEETKRAAAATPSPPSVPSPSGTTAAAPTSTSSSGGPPLAGIVGLGAAIALSLLGVWLFKRRHAATP